MWQIPTQACSNFFDKKTTSRSGSENLTTWDKSASNTYKGTWIISGIVSENKELDKELSE